MAAGLAGCHPQAQTRAARIVVLISLDGATPAGIAQADAPNLHRLMASGAESRNAQTLFPCKTLPCHISMLSGATPQKHGIEQNTFSDPLPVLTVPTVFDAVDHAGLDALMIVGKYKLLALRSGHFAPLEEVGAMLRRETRHHMPDFVFIHSAEPDLAGHDHGWMTPAYLAALSKADAMVGEVVDWIHSKGAWAEALVLISADHGGHGKTHSGLHTEDTMIPWIAAGGMVRARSLPDGARIHDIAPTVLTALGLPIPASCEGKAMAALFERNPASTIRVLAHSTQHHQPTADALP